MKRFLGTVAVLVFGIAGWTVFATRPSSAWACESESRISCTHREQLELDTDDLVVDFIDDIDVDRTGDRLAVAVFGHDPATMRQTGGVAVVDASTGSVLRWLVQGDDVARTEDLAFSPDGRLIGTFVVRLVDDEVAGELVAVGQFEIYEVESASLVSSLQTEPYFSCGRMGFSADNTEAQCGSLLIDTASGRQIGQLSAENRYGVSSTTRSSWGLGDVWADQRGNELRVRTREPGWEPGDPQQTVAVDLDVPADSRRAWTRLSVRGDRAAALHAGPATSWTSSFTSRASQQPPSTLTLVDLKSDSPVETIGIGFEAWWGGWSANGEFLVVVDRAGGQFMVVQTPQG